MLAVDVAPLPGGLVRLEPRDDAPLLELGDARALSKNRIMDVPYRPCIDSL